MSCNGLAVVRHFYCGAFISCFFFTDMDNQELYFLYGRNLLPNWDDSMYRLVCDCLITTPAEYITLCLVSRAMKKKTEAMKVFIRKLAVSSLALDTPSLPGLVQLSIESVPVAWFRSTSKMEAGSAKK